MIDTHFHLTDPRLEDQLDGVLDRAAAAGVSRLITIATALPDSRRAVMLCQNRPQLRCAVGVHPLYVDESDLAELPTLRDIQDSPAVVAIGEIGLDYFRGKSSKVRQLQFLLPMLQMAVETGRPVVVHCREAVDECLAILKDFPGLGGVFHCFTGTADEADRILDAGYLLGFTGVVTFKPNEPLRDVVRRTPLDRILVETDAPYLSPEPVRKQKVNEPSLVMHVARRVAEIKGVPLETLDAETTANATALFGWPGK